MQTLQQPTNMWRVIVIRSGKECQSTFVRGRYNVMVRPYRPWCDRAFAEFIVPTKPEATR